MATLEVHDGRGQVFQVEVSHEAATLFGSDPSCDVVVNDPRAQPFHARLRWKKDGYRIEAFPEARGVSVNGVKVASGRINQGDELKIGEYRIFLLADAETAAPTSRSAAAPAAGGGLDWIDAEDGEPAPPPPTSRSGGRKKAAEAALPAEDDDYAPPPPPARVSWGKRLIRSVNAGAAPGEEKIARSPLILALLLILGMMSLIGYGLWTVIARNQANRLYNLATAAYDERDYKGAVEAFDDFLASTSSDFRGSRARVLRELSNVRQFSAANASAWNSAVEAARQMYEKTQDEAFYPDAKMDLAAEVLKAAGGILQSAARTADPKRLAEGMETLALYDQIVGPPSKTLREKAEIPEQIAAAEAAVEKARVRRESIAAMAEQVKANAPEAVFQARDVLVTRYPDLANDKELVAQLDAASELIRQAVTFDESGRPAEADPHPDPLGPPVSLVFRQVPPGAKAEPPTSGGPLVFALAHGYLYAIDGGNGAPIWHAAVGLTSPFAPLSIAGQPESILLFDARFDEMVRLEGRTGKLLWRQPLGEAINAPPLVLGNQIVQATPSGKLLFLSLTDGSLQGTLDFGRPLAGTPAADDTGQFFYVTADRDCVFVVSRSPTECVAVSYLGHKPGSIKAAPARLAEFLIVPHDDDLWQGRWAVFGLENDGESLRLLQSVPVPGWTWQTPVSQGAILWSLTDRNAISAFGVAPEGTRDPLRRVAESVPDARPSGPGYARARSDREIWISGSRLGRFDLDTERGSLTANWTIERAGPSLAPIQIASRLAVFTHQFEDGPGVALWGVDPSNGKVAWKSVLGAPWPLTPTPAPDDSTLTTLAMDGPEFVFSTDLLASGGFVEMPLRRPGYFNLPTGPLRRLERDGLTVLVPAPEADHLLVRADKSGDFRRIDLPAPLGAAPIFWGPDLFIPGLDGRAYLVDPRTGEPRAEPYVPTFDARAPTRWLDPVFLDENSVLLVNQSGVLQRLSRQSEPRVKLVAVGEPEDLKATIDAAPAATRESVIVSTGDGKVRSLSTRDLSALGAWDLSVPRALGPIALDDGHAVVFDKGGGILYFTPNGDRAWTADMGDEPPIGTPLLKQDSLWLLSRDGALQRRDAQDGSPLDRLVLNVLPDGGLWHVGPDLVLPVAPGTLRRVLPDAIGANP